MFRAVWRLVASLATFTSLCIGAALVLGYTPPPEPVCDLGILFGSDTGLERGLFWVRPDGTDVQTVVDLNDYVDTGAMPRTNVSLAPDGEQLIIGQPLLGSERGYRFDLLNLVTGDSRQLMTTAARNRQFFWSPDGGKVAFITSYSDEVVRVLDLATGDVQHIADSTVSPVSDYLVGGRFNAVDWSPDGERLVLNAYRETGITASVSVVLEVNADGQIQRAVPRNRYRSVWAWREWSPTWSTDDMLYYGCVAHSGGRGGVCGFDGARSLAVQVFNANDFTVENNSRLATADATPDGRVVYTTTGNFNRMMVYDTFRHTFSDVGGVRGFSPRWMCKPTVAG